MTALTLALVFSRVLFHFLKLKHPSQMSTVFRLQMSAAVKNLSAFLSLKKSKYHHDNLRSKKRLVIDRYIDNNLALI